MRYKSSVYVVLLTSDAFTLVKWFLVHSSSSDDPDSVKIGLTSRTKASKNEIIKIH